MHPSGDKTKNREGVDTTPTLQSSPTVLTRLMANDAALNEGVKAKMMEVFNKYQELVDLSTVTDARSKHGFTVIPNSAFDPAPDYLMEPGVGHVKTFSPLELLATAILILVHHKSRTNQMLLGDIKEMRHFLRENEKDLRVNNVCWRVTWSYIDEIMVQRRGGRGAVRKRNFEGVGGADFVVDDGQDSDEVVEVNFKPTATTSRQQALDRKRSSNQAGSSTNEGGNSSTKSRYLASATPHGALADPNAPASRAFEKPNPLAVPLAPMIDTPSSSAVGGQRSRLTSPQSKRRFDVGDLGETPSMTKIKMPRR
jgi:hypothetical protein